MGLHMVSLSLLLGAVVVLSASGLPAWLGASRMPNGQRVTTVLLVLGSLAGLAGLAGLIHHPEGMSWRLPWFLPWGAFAVGVDAIGAVFLVPVFVVPALAAVYGLGYWKQADHPDNSGRLGAFCGLLAGTMALVVLARDGMLFLLAWEGMAISAYFAATADEDNPEARQAGWVYLVATHVGTLCLMAMFALWNQVTGSYALEPAGEAPTHLANAVFLLAVLGFGFKAGLMPLHVWLPGAHANAPSHVSAVLSGVMLKMGIYGIVRMTALLPMPAAWWGGTLLTAGAVTGVAGIAFAIGQKDVKRMLAYSSIENVGIIAMGIGLALLGRTHGRVDWALLGMGGALFHVWNHSLFKSLLFFAAGAIMHATGTRNMERLGGLGKRMPQTLILFTVGAVSICALPPLNGFCGEWLLYAGFFRTLGPTAEPGLAAAGAGAVVLALIGALAMACFAKAVGVVFLGAARTDDGARAHDPAIAMFAPMAMLAGGCALLGVFPALATPWLGASAAAWIGNSGVAAPSLNALAPVEWITIMGLAMAVPAAIVAIAIGVPMRRRTPTRSVTWDCGYAAPTARMQYTGSSFSQSVPALFRFVMRPVVTQTAVSRVFPRAARFETHLPDTVLDRLVLPLFRLLDTYLPWLRILQQGQTHLYLLYILTITIVLFVVGRTGG